MPVTASGPGGEGAELPTTGRVLGVDLGSKRIGVAVSDSGRSIASPLVVVQRSGSLAADHKALGRLVAEEEACLVVVGLPIDLQGRRAQAAEGVLAELAPMRAALTVPVVTWDERMTTAAAHKALAAQGVSTKKRREQIDKYAAAVMLQGWIDADRWGNGT